MNKILVGIDTGVHTGFAVAIDSGQGGRLIEVQSRTITQAMARVLELIGHYDKSNVKLYIEDARLRTWYGDADNRLKRSGAGIREGVGSVKRDAQIWEDWCKENHVNYKMIHPASNATKKNAIQFKNLTGWGGKTNEHARDAAMLVFQRFAKF